MAQPCFFSVLDISLHVAKYLDFDAIMHANGASKNMKSSGLAFMPIHICIEKLSWSLIRFDCSAVTTIVLRTCPSNIMNEWFAAFLSQCNFVLYIDLSWCPHRREVGLQAIATHCKNLRGVDISESLSVTDTGVQALAKECTDLERICLRGLEHVSDTSLETIAGFCKQLITIDFDDTNLSDAGAKCLAESCLNLRFAWVAGTLITDIGARALAQRCSLSVASAGDRNLGYNLCVERNDFSDELLESLRATFPLISVHA